MDSTQGQCPRCGDINARSRIACDCCGARLPWADEAKNYEYSPSIVALHQVKPHPQQVPQINKFASVSTILLTVSLLAFIILTIPVYISGKSTRFPQFGSYLVLSAYLSLLVTSILCLWAGIYSKILDYWNSKQRVLGWSDAVPLIMWWAPIFGFVLYSIATISPNAVALPNAVASDWWNLPLHLIVQSFATSVALNVMAHRRQQKPVLFVAALAGILFCVVLIPRLFTSAIDDSRFATLQINAH